MRSFRWLLRMVVSEPDGWITRECQVFPLSLIYKGPRRDSTFVGPQPREAGPARVCLLSTWAQEKTWNTWAPALMERETCPPWPKAPHCLSWVPTCPIPLPSFQRGCQEVGGQLAGADGSTPTSRTLGTQRQAAGGNSIHRNKKAKSQRQ